MLLLLGLSFAVLLLAGVLYASSTWKKDVQEVPLVVPAPAPAPEALPADASPEQLVRAGRKLDAIRRYRELTGVGLKEAKAAIEGFERDGVLALPAKTTLLRQVHDSEIEAQIRSGHLIDAIRLYREKTGVGLREAKDAIEAWRNRMRAS